MMSSLFLSSPLCVLCSCPHCSPFRTINSPENLADEATSLLADHLAPGPIFAQDQVGALTPNLAVGAGSALALWDRTPLEEIRLSVLERICTLGQADRAVHLLNRKIRIAIDARYVLPVTDCLFRSTSRLDFFAAVPRFPGLSVILPPAGIQPPVWWNFKLDFRSPHRAFHYKHGKLGFRPDRATCYIGSSDSLDMWVIFVPDEKLDEDATILPAGSTFSDITQLSSRHLRQFLSWMIYCLSLIGYPGIHLRSNRRYSVNLDHNSPDWSFVTGFRYVTSMPYSLVTIFIFASRPASQSIQLNHQQARALHGVFTRDNYRAWQRAAPRDWRDVFFNTRVPLVIASRYGQDEELIFTPRAAEQLQERMRWDDLSSVSFALATDIEYVDCLDLLSIVLANTFSS